MHPLLLSGVSRRDLPEYKHWEWTQKAQRFYSEVGYEFWGIQANGDMQGMMLININNVCRAAPQTGAPLVYVDYLATAPWNLRALTATPTLRAIGRTLISTAIRASQNNGFAGRIGLHSLPQAESFYREPAQCLH